MARSGEYVVRKEAVDELGTDFMDMINNADRLGYTGGGLVPKGEHGHSAIDELLAINTLNNQDSIEETRKSAGFITGGDIDMSGQEGGGGGAYSNNYVPNAFFNSLYQQYGFAPTDDEIKSKFEETFGLDLGDAYAEIEEGYGSLRDRLMVPPSQSTFAGSGIGERRIMENRERLEDIARMRSEGVISSSIDEQMQSALAALAEREEAGADFEAYQPATAYSGSQSPSSGYMVVGQLPDTNQGKVEYNGEVYTWMEDLGQYIQGDF
jgi:hypothetical protein